MSVLCLKVNDKVIVEKIMNGGKNKILQYSRYLEFTKMAKIGPNLEKKTVF